MKGEKLQGVENAFAQTCSLVMALALLTAGVATLVDPSQKNPARFWQILLTTPGWFLTARYSLVLAAVMGLGVAAALRHKLAAVHRGWADWLYRVAQLTFFSTAISNVQIASIDVPYVWIDSKGILWLSGMGLWALGSNLLALRGGVLPRGPVLLGVATGVVLCCVPIADVLDYDLLWFLAVAGGSMFVGPLWLLALARCFSSAFTLRHRDLVGEEAI